MRGKKRSGSTEKISGGCSGPRDFIPEYDKIYCVSEPVRKQVIARFPELADRTEVLLNFIDIKQVQRRSEEPLSDPQYTGELKFLTVGRASEEKRI